MKDFLIGILALFLVGFLLWLIVYSHNKKEVEALLLPQGFKPCGFAQYIRPYSSDTLEYYTITPFIMGKDGRFLISSADFALDSLPAYMGNVLRFEWKDTANPAIIRRVEYPNLNPH